MTDGKHGSKSRREIMGWSDFLGKTTNVYGKLIGSYPSESIMDYIIVEVKSKKYPIPISNELYEELYKKANKSQEFRTIVGWDELNGYPYNNRRNYYNRRVEYPDEFIMDYIIEKAREREYNKPLTIKLYKQLCAEAQKILNERNRVAEASFSQANNNSLTALQQRNSRNVNSANSPFSNLGSVNSQFSNLGKKNLANSPFSSLGSKNK
jgi:hypothetical protein